MTILGRLAALGVAVCLFWGTPAHPQPYPSKPIRLLCAFPAGGIADIVKALAMGAQGVCVGRPFVWGLGAFGQPGVERVLELLRIELRAIMQQVGAPSLKDLKPAMVRRA